MEDACWFHGLAWQNYRYFNLFDSHGPVTNLWIGKPGSTLLSKKTGY